MRDHRQVVKGVTYRYRCGARGGTCRPRSGPGRPVWKRHRGFGGDETRDQVFAALMARADADGQIDWTVSVHSTINRAHQHGTNPPREPRTGEQHNDKQHDNKVCGAAPAAAGINTAAEQVADPLGGSLRSSTGGSVEVQGSASPAK